ncbi:hypothetical protein [Desulfurispira natronophila]|uniref:Thiosulfate reductase cytochrome b subunit n=1 Tax=Desulfurispira natronophila TaxID=682562 RepID=A0A7W7Y477_9BACT|nr:hypothetical protein [Desulfurispira natronophila]MBB5021522.1 thiosulfate reductase cytochrome b subunit [Desulfurispira natronophila]
MKLPDRKTQRQWAKAGMTITLGATLLTGFHMKGRTAKQVHFAAGIALVGFSIWHHQLYHPASKDKSIAAEKVSPVAPE